MFRILSTAIVIGTVTVLCSSHVRADDLPQAERDKIEHLIQFVANGRDAVFVRNGREYDGQTAAKYMRRKWESTAGVASAADFIAKVASVSSSSGKPYAIRFKDGKEISSTEHLTAELRRIEAK